MYLYYNTIKTIGSWPEMVLWLNFLILKDYPKTKNGEISKSTPDDSKFSHVVGMG